MRRLSSAASSAKASVDSACYRCLFCFSDASERVFGVAILILCLAVLVDVVSPADSVLRSFALSQFIKTSVRIPFLNIRITLMRLLPFVIGVLFAFPILLNMFCKKRKSASIAPQSSPSRSRRPSEISPRVRKSFSVSSDGLVEIGQEPLPDPASVLPATGLSSTSALTSSASSSSSATDSVSVIASLPPYDVHRRNSDSSSDGAGELQRFVSDHQQDDDAVVQNDPPLDLHLSDDDDEQAPPDNGDDSDSHSDEEEDGSESSGDSSNEAE